MHFSHEYWVTDFWLENVRCTSRKSTTILRHSSQRARQLDCLLYSTDFMATSSCTKCSCIKAINFIFWTDKSQITTHSPHMLTSEYLCDDTSSLSSKRSFEASEYFSPRPELKRRKSEESLCSSSYDNDDTSIYSENNICQEANYDTARLCKVPLCGNEHLKRSPYCTYHCGSRACIVADCKRAAQGTTPFCIGHGGGKRCQFPDCSKFDFFEKFITNSHVILFLIVKHSQRCPR